MLSSKKTYEALRRKRDAWESARQQTSHYLRQARQALAALSLLGGAELSARLEATAWSGARPTPEHDRHPSQVVEFARNFSCHETARAWATGVLEGQRRPMQPTALRYRPCRSTCCLSAPPRSLGA